MKRFKIKVEVRKICDDPDGFNYAVLVNGSICVTGVHKNELPHYKKKALEWYNHRAKAFAAYERKHPPKLQQGNGAYSECS